MGQRLFPVTIPSTQGTVSVPIEGKVNIIVPQYVRCPDVCHYETLIMKSLMIKLSQENSIDNVVFVTVEVDPWRGTLEEAEAYIREATASLGFNPPWIWVGGDREALETIYKQLGISVQLDSSSGLVVHTAGFYIVD
ncbi:SCO family protein [Aeropyrum camini]|uniref:SCO family protein n=1 Tax=Aeropyrum camini TaxID=229980 RepID=UPI000787439C|nr:SCO family protein [Aeropyrum camini]